MVALSLPAIIASNAPFTASIDTMRMSLPGLRPASSMAWMAPMAMSSLCAYSTWILRDSDLRMASMALLALGAREIAGLRANDLQMRIRGDDLFEPLLAIVGRRGAHRALQLDDVHVRRWRP